jgi:hypothetical protein
MKVRAHLFRSFAILPFLLAVSSPIWAGQNEIELGTLMSRYIWRGIRLSDGVVYQSSLTYGYKGIALNLWGNVDFKTTKLNEIDFTFSYERDIGKIGLESGLIHYGIFDGTDTDEIYATFSADGPLNPSLSVYFDVKAGKGAYVEASAGHTVDLSSHVALEMTGSIGFVIYDGYMGLTDAGREFAGLYGGKLVAALPIKFKDHWRLSPTMGVTTPFSHNGRQAIVNGSVLQADNSSFRGTTVYGGVTLTFSF